MDSSGVFTIMNPAREGITGDHDDGGGEGEHWDDNDWGAGPLNPNPLRVGRKINMDHVQYRWVYGQ
jgi:hypothetical protein